MDINQIVDIALMGLAGLLIVLPVLWGLIRGWKKGLFRFVWCFVTALVLLFTTFFLAKWAMTFDLTKFGTNIDGYKTLQDFCIAKLQEVEQIRELMSYSTTLKEFIVVLPVLLLSSILFTLLYWILKWLLWPIWAILSRVCIKKYKVRYEEGKKIKTKKKKGRLFGALTGVALGYLTCVVTFTPVIGISNFANDLDKKYKMNDGQGVVTSALEGMTEGNSQYLALYENSTAKKILRYTGINGLSTLLFQQLSTSLDKNAISLTDEADRMVGVYVDVDTISRFKLETLTQAELDSMLSAVRNIITSVFESKLVKPLVDEIVPNFVTSLVDGTSTIMTLPTIEQPVFNKAFLDSIATLQNMDANMIKSELLAIMDIIDVFNKEKMILPMLQNPDDVDVPLMISWASETFADNLANAFFKLNHVVSITPILFNAVIEYGCDELGATFEQATVNMDKIKNCFAGMIQTVVLACQDYETKPKYYVSQTTIEQMASVVDDLLHSNIITDTTKQSLTVKVKEKVIEMYEKMELPSELNIFVSEFSDAILNLEDFKQEIVIFGDIYQSMWTTTNGKPFDKEQYDELGLASIGHWLDLLTQSKIYDVTITSLLDNGIDYALTFLPEDMDSLKQPMKELVGNFKVVHNKAKEENTEITPTKGVWKDELQKLQVFYNQMVKVLPELKHLDTALTETDVLNNIGVAFDDLLNGNSLLIKKENINALFEAVLDYVEMPQDIASIKVGDKSIVEQLKQNIAQIDGVERTWTKEMAVMKNLLNTDFNIQDESGNYHLDKIGRTLDNLKTSTLFGNMINPILTHFIDTIKEDYIAKGSDLDLVIADVLQGMKDNLDSVDSFEDELTALNSVFGGLTDLTLESAGDLLDELAGTKLLGNQIHKVLVYYIDEYTKDLDSAYSTVIELIKENLTTLEQGDYSVEIEYIKSVVDFLNKDVLEKEDLDKIVKDIVDDDGNSKSKLISNAVIQEVIDVTFDVLVKANLGGYSDSEILVSLIKDNITNVENITNLLGAVDTLKEVAGELTGSIGSVQDITNNQDKILESIGTLYENAVVGAEATKVVTDITLDLIQKSVEGDSGMTDSEKENIMSTIEQTKADVTNATNVDELKDSLSTVIALLGR